MHFCRVFSDTRLKTRFSTKRGALCSFRRALSNSSFGKVLLIYFASAWINLLKHCVTAEFFTMEGYVQGALRKKLLIAFLIQHFRTTTLGKVSYTNTLNKMSNHCTFLDRRIRTTCFTEGAAHCCFYRALSNMFFGKSLLIHFVIICNSLLKHIISVEFLLMKDDVLSALQKVLFIAFCCS